jgi:hypothetical protein
MLFLESRTSLSAITTNPSLTCTPSSYLGCSSMLVTTIWIVSGAASSQLTDVLKIMRMARGTQAAFVTTLKTQRAFITCIAPSRCSSIFLSTSFVVLQQHEIACHPAPGPSSRLTGILSPQLLLKLVPPERPSFLSRVRLLQNIPA